MTKFWQKQICTVFRHDVHAYTAFSASTLLVEWH